MVDKVKVLAQVTPSAAVLTTAYTVPANTTTTISSYVVCNTNVSTSNFRISIQVNGAADNIKQYLYYDLPILGNDTFIGTIGVTLGSGDVVAVQAMNTNVAFSLFGIEIV